MSVVYLKDLRKRDFAVSIVFLSLLLLLLQLIFLFYDNYGELCLVMFGLV